MDNAPQNFEQFLTIKRVLMGLKKEYTEQPKDAQELELLRLIAKFEKLQKGVQPAVLVSVAKSVLANAELLVAYSENRYNNSVLKAMSCFIKDQPLTAFEGLDVEIASSESVYKGVSFTGKVLVDSAVSLNVSVSAPESSFMHDVLKDLAIKPSLFNYCLPKTVQEYAELKAQMAQDEDQVKRAVIKKIEGKKKRLEGKLIELGIAPHEVSFLKSFW